MRGILFISSFVLLLAGCKPPQQDVRNLLTAVPLQSAMLFQFQNVSAGFEKFSGTAVANTLDSLKVIADWQEQLTGLKGLLLDADGQPLAISAIAAIHLSGGAKYDVLWLASDQILGTLRKVPGVVILSEKDYGATKIISFKTNRGHIFSYTNYKGIIALSKSEILVEEAIKQIDAPIKIDGDPLFKKAFESANARDPIHIFLNLKYVPALATWGMPETGHQWMAYFASWVALDAELKVDQLALSGLALLNDSIHPYLLNWKKNSPRSFSAPEIMPVQTAAFVALTAENFPQQFRARNAFLNYHNKSAQYKRYQSDMPIDGEAFFSSHVLHEWGIFYAEEKRADIFGNKFGYIEAKDPEKVILEIEGMPGSMLIETYRDKPIYRLGVASLLPHTLGQLFWGLNDVYVAYHLNFVVFCSNFAQMKGLINDWQDGKTLHKAPSFKAFSKEFPSKGHIWAVAAQPASLAYAPALFKKELALEIQKNTQSLKENRWLGVHFRVSDQAAFTHLVVKQDAEQAPDTRRRWTLALKAPVISQPTLVKNHLNGQNEIFAQDSTFQIYLVDGKGQLLWQRQVDGPILGDVTQVDLYKNNKLQLVFNTPSKLYVIDRNGNDVAPFPIKLPETATAGAGIFDYDNTRNYRFVIPLGQDLYNYGADGREVSGWIKPRSVSPIYQPPQHIRVGAFDYILVYTRSGQIRLLNRKGEDRVNVAGTFPIANKKLFLYQGDEATEARLTGLTENGKLINIYFDGKADSLDAGLGSAVSLIMLDDKYLLAGKRKLQLRDPKNPFEVTTPGNIEIGPYFFNVSGHAYFGVGSSSDKQIWVYREDGKMIPGFPVYGSTPFVFGQFTESAPPALIVGSGDGNLICYLFE
jgi:hypothetical protein